MKILILPLLLTVAIRSFAEGISVSGSSARTNTPEIVWAAPSNHWPSTIWVYQVAPQHFAPVVVSNLMAMASFTTANRTNVEGQPPFKDKRLLYFANKDRTRYLGIYPPFGWVDYNDETAIAKIKEEPVGIPTEQEAYKMAVEYLRKFGIDRSQLSTKGDSLQLRIYREEGSQGWFDKAKGTNVTRIISRGVDFIRRVDGIDFIGLGLRGGVCFTFGNNGKIAALEIVWKGLEPFELHKTLSAEEMLKIIQSGKGKKWTPYLTNPSAIKKITITDVLPYYRGIGGDDEDKFIEPYAILATSVDYGFTNVIATVECPILGELAK